MPPLAGHEERVGIVRAIFEASEAERALGSLGGAFDAVSEKVDAVDKKMSEAEGGTEDLGDGIQKLSVLAGQQGLAGDLADVAEGLGMVEGALGPAGTAVAIGAAAVTLMAGAAVSLRGALDELVRSTLAAEEAAGRKLSPELQRAKATMEGYDGAIQEHTRTLTELTVPAYEALSNGLLGVSSIAVELLSDLKRVGEYKPSSDSWLGSIATAYSATTGTGWRVQRALLTGGGSELAPAIGGYFAGVGERDSLIAQGDVMRAGLAGQTTAPLEYSDGVKIYGPSPDQIKDVVAKRTADEKALAEAIKARAAADREAAAAEAERAGKEREMLALMSEYQRRFETTGMMDPRYASVVARWATYAGEAGDTFVRESAASASFRREQLAQQVTVQGGSDWISGSEWGDPYEMSDSERRGWLRMAGGKSARPDLSGLGKGLMAGLQGATALSGGMAGISGALGSAGPYGMAAAAGIQILQDPEALLKGAREVGKFIDKLPEQVVTLLVDVAPKIIAMLPEMIAGVLSAVLVEIPKAIAQAIGDWWYDATHKTERERRQQERGERAMQRRFDRVYGDKAEGVRQAQYNWNTFGPGSSSYSRSSSPRRPSLAGMGGMGQAMVIHAHAGVTDDAAGALALRVTDAARRGVRRRT